MDFGDAFVLNQLLEQTGLATGLAALPQSDSLKALLCFYVLGSARLEAAPDWLSTSYAQVLYLKAHLDHAVKLLTALVSEPSCACLSRWMAAQPHEAVVAIESAGLPQSVQFPVSAVNGLQDAYSEALRLVFMVDQVTGAPLALSCGAEGELSALLAALPPNWVVLDRPYVTAADWQYLHAQGRDFVSHLERTNPTAQELIAQHLATLQDAQYLEQYGEQIIFIKRVAVPLRDAHGEVICSGWAYLCCELEQRQRAERALFLALARSPRAILSRSWRRPEWWCSLRLSLWRRVSCGCSMSCACATARCLPSSPVIRLQHRWSSAARQAYAVTCL